MTDKYEVWACGNNKEWQCGEIPRKNTQQPPQQKPMTLFEAMKAGANPHASGGYTSQQNPFRPSNAPAKNADNSTSWKRIEDPKDQNLRFQKIFCGNYTTFCVPFSGAGAYDLYFVGEKMFQDGSASLLAGELKPVPLPDFSGFVSIFFFKILV